jgi:site-specific recombinase XerD
MRSFMARFIPDPEQCVQLVSIEGGFEEQIFNAALGMLYGTGMLPRELLELRPRDIWSGERMRIEIGGSRARRVPVPSGAANRLTRLLEAIGSPSDDVFIFRKSPVWIGVPAIAVALKRRSALLGFPQPLVPSDLKIAFVRHMIDRGAAIEYVVAIMGLKSVLTLETLFKRLAS